jgi:hypothetical protein
MMKVAIRALPVALALFADPTPAQARVLFENAGVKAGWDSFTSPDQVTEVSTPTPYGTGTTLRMLQQFHGYGSYHCEVRKHGAEKVGEDLYFGEALQLPSNWVFHDQNVTFQQYARSDTFGSAWSLLFIQRDHLYAAFDGSGLGQVDVGSVAGLQGTWIRLVVRLKLLSSGGLFEVWINGTRTGSVNVNYTKGGPGVRWSVGMYCTYWRREQPAGLNPMILFHDQLRIATTLEEADPASWTAGKGPVVFPDAGVPGSDAPPVGEDAAGGAGDSRSGGDASSSPGGNGGTSGAGGGSSGADAAAPDRASPGGSGGDEGTEGDGGAGGSPAGKRVTSGGCRVGNGAGSTHVLVAVMVALGLLRRRRGSA